MDFVDHLLRQYDRQRIDAIELQSRLVDVALDLRVGDPDLCRNTLETGITSVVRELRPQRLTLACFEAIQASVIPSRDVGVSTPSLPLRRTA